MASDAAQLVQADDWLSHRPANFGGVTHRNYRLIQDYFTGVLKEPCNLILQVEQKTQVESFFVTKSTLTPPAYRRRPLTCNRLY